jgi:hypothetical protein
MLAQRTSRCCQSFQACLGKSNSTDEEWLINRLADFELWATGIGAALRNRSSLDSRLKDRPDIRDVMGGLIQSLQDILQQYESSCKLEIPSAIIAIPPMWCV